MIILPWVAFFIAVGYIIYRGFTEKAEHMRQKALTEPTIATIDLGGTHMTLAGLDMALTFMREGKDVLIKNCSGGDLLTLGFYLMAAYEKAKKQTEDAV